MKILKIFIFFVLLCIMVIYSFNNLEIINAFTNEMEESNEVAEVKINQSQLNVIKNAPKSGGIFPVEITAIDGGVYDREIIYITVEPTWEVVVKTTTEEGNNLTNDLTVEEEVEDDEGGTVNQFNTIYTYSYSETRKSSYIEEKFGFIKTGYTNFVFVSSLSSVFLIFQILFFKLQYDIKNEVKKLN